MSIFKHKMICKISSKMFHFNPHSGTEIAFGASNFVQKFQNNSNKTLQNETFFGLNF